MLTQPDPLRQRCIDLSAALQAGHTLVQSFTWTLFDERYRERATTTYQAFATWYGTVCAVLNADERPGFERIRAKPINPSWDEAWDIALGHRENTWVDGRGYKRDLYNTRLAPYMEEMLQYLTAVRLQAFPPSVLSNELRTELADQFRNMRDYVIDDLFHHHGCLIDWWILPLRPTTKKSVDRALGWIDGLILYQPDDLIVQLQSVYRSLAEHKRGGAELLTDPVYTALSGLQSTPLPPPRGDYIDPQRLAELRQLTSPAYDVTKLIQLCEELNACIVAGHYLAVAMLTRAILDHVPPIFGLTKFSEVASNYPGSKSFKESMGILAGSMRKIADAHLHTQIRPSEVLPTRRQVDVGHDLDVLFGEIVRLLKRL